MHSPDVSKAHILVGYLRSRTFLADHIVPQRICRVRNACAFAHSAHTLDSSIFNDSHHVFVRAGEDQLSMHSMRGMCLEAFLPVPSVTLLPLAVSWHRSAWYVMFLIPVCSRWISMLVSLYTAKSFMRCSYKVQCSITFPGGPVAS